MLSSFFKKPVQKVSPEALKRMFFIENPGIIGKNIPDTFLNNINDSVYKKKFRELMENTIDTNGFTPFMHIIESNVYGIADLMYILYIAEPENYSWLKLNFQNNNGDTAFMIALKMQEEGIIEKKPKYLNFLQRFVKINPSIINLAAKNNQGLTAFDIATMLNIESIKNYISENYEDLDTSQSGSDSPDIKSLTPTSADFVSLNISYDTTGINLITRQEIPVKQYLLDGIEQIEEEGREERIQERMVSDANGKLKRDESGKPLKEKIVIPAYPAKERIIAQDKTDLIAFKLGESFYLSKRSILTNRLVNNSTLYECNTVTTGHKPTKEMVIPDSKIFNIKIIGVPSNPIFFKYLSFILNKKYNMFEIVNTDKKAVSMVSKYIYDTLGTQAIVSVVSAAHCQEGQDAQLAKLNIINYTFTSETIGGKKSYKKKYRKYNKKTTKKYNKKTLRKKNKKTKKISLYH
jgi:hypothetical protein